MTQRKQVWVWRVILGVAGVYSIVTGIATKNAVEEFPERGHPMSSVSSLAVDFRGQIYCAAQFWDAIDVYNARGTFLHSINAGEADRGTMLIRFNEEHALEVVSNARPDSVFVYSAAGTLVAVRNEAKAFFHFPLSDPPTATDAAGNTYVVQGGKLIRVAADGLHSVLVVNDTIVVSPKYMWRFQLGAVYLIIGFVIGESTAKLMTEFCLLGIMPWRLGRLVRALRNRGQRRG